jgi:predicted dehydrogenase
MVKMGVIGAGYLGQWHIKNLQTLTSTELIGFFDADSARQIQIAQEFQTPIFRNLDDLLDKCDAVSIVVPTISHYPVAKSALLQNKHVFCEKPFMQTIAEADEIIALAHQKKRVLQVGHIERFNPALASLKHIAVDPLFIESHRIAPFNPRGTDVAVILDLMIHDIDIILSLVKSEIEQIDAAGAPVLTKNIDIANARLKFTNGCVANITASRVANKQMRKMRIFQRDAYISIDFLKNQTEIYSLTENSLQLPPGTTAVAEVKTDADHKRVITYQTIETPQSNALKAELKAFIGAIENGTKPPVTGEDGKKALEIAIQIEDQINNNLKRVL